MVDKFKTVSLDTMLDKHIGKRGTKRRDAFENELRIDLLGQAIKQARQEHNLTQVPFLPIRMIFGVQLPHLPGIRRMTS